jgi:hypothetical protein
MALAEKFIKEKATRSPERYAARVRTMALVYLALDTISIIIIVAIAWRVRYFITLSQRSNVETLTLAIVFILALYYLLTTFKGFIGAIRMAWLNFPKILSKDEKQYEKVEQRKHSALPQGRETISAYFDQAIVQEGKPNEPIKWELVDSAGKLGEIELDGVEAKYYPIKDGMNDSLFEFLGDQIEKAMQKSDLDAKLQITQWSSIDEDKSSAYHRMVQAFQNLEKQIGKKGPIWPTVEIKQEDVEEIGKELRRLVPALRNESLLPDVEYEVEYSVPILPEPLGFMRLTRRENRADPVITMGCAGIIMLFVLLIIIVFIIWPPWVPSK